jgi:hypothetical protein
MFLHADESKYGGGVLQSIITRPRHFNICVPQAILLVVASSGPKTPRPIDRAGMDLRYPIGPYSPPLTIGRAELDALIAE